MVHQGDENIFKCESKVTGISILIFQKLFNTKVHLEYI